MGASELADRLDVIDVVNRYATALDARDWDLLDRVFAEDVRAEFGRPLPGRAAVKELVRAHLGGCGPTQHLLANHRVEVAGDEATCVTSVRAFHAGRGSRAGQTYELFGEYHDRLRRGASGWRIVARRMVVTHETGSREVLGPG
jgi:3-phenylpropionate/cinnamic acid dioxygenase small subunit